MEKALFSVEGYADDLLTVSDNGEMKMTRLFLTFPENPNENHETFDFTITSTNPYKEFPLFDKLLGKKIRISVISE